METRRRRVAAMAPDDRRAALIAATIPLLHEHGIDVSTRQIATAAGVAEGTIFGVFETKTALVVCSVVAALDPQPTIDALAAIDRAAPLRERLIAATTLVHERFAENAALMVAARRMMATGEAPQAAGTMTTWRERMQEAVADVIGPDAALLRRPPAAVSRLLMLFCGAHTFGPLGDPEFSSEETVSLLLDGLIERGIRPTC